MRHRFNSIKFIPRPEKSTKNSAKPRRTKLSASFSTTDRQPSDEEVREKGSAPELEQGHQPAIDVAALLEAAMASMLRALRQEKNGRLALQVLKTIGGPMQCSKNNEDRRSEKEKRRDNTVKAMTGVMMAKLQLTPTATVSPRLFATPFPVRSVKTGVGTAVTPPTTGRAQLIAVASLMSWFLYCA